MKQRLPGGSLIDAHYNYIEMSLNKTIMRGVRFAEGMSN